MAAEQPARKESKAQRAERIKREKDGLDVLDDLLRYSKLGWEAIEPDDLDRFKWYGLYPQQPKAGHFMLRLRLPNGEMRAQQLAVVAELTARFARGFADVTTRQNLQLHWLTIEDIPYILTRLAAVGVTTVEACGDTPRNVVGCPLHGVDPGELYDARGLVDDVNRLFVANRAFSNLPRKFKISIGGCRLRCAQPEINDIGVSAIARPRRGGVEVGFEAVVGGGLSTVPRLAQRLPFFFQPWQVRPVCAAIGAIFREHGNRDKRTAARLKFLVEAWGIERFAAELVDRLDFAPDTDLPPLPALPRERDHLGVLPQRQPGLHSVGLATRLGRLTAEQLALVGRLATEHGDGVVRFTNNQNLVLLSVPTARVDEVVRQANNALLPADADIWQRNFVACTGAQFCNLALTDTKLDPGADSPAEAALRALQERLGHFRHFVRINYNGCPNACGQHWIADVGLQGVRLKGPGGEEVPGALVTVGGGLGQQSGFGRNTGIRLPLTAVPDALVRLFTAFEQQAESAEDDFHAFVGRTSDDELRALLTGAES